MPSSTNIQKVVSRRAMLFCLLFLIAVTLVLSLRWASQNSLLTLSSSQPYTELYFAKPNELPKNVTFGEGHSVSITLANHEGSQKTYHYEVTVYEGEKRTSTTKHTVTLNESQSKILQLPYTVQASGQKTLVIITLLSTNQRIQFYTQS